MISWEHLRIPSHVWCSPVLTTFKLPILGRSSQQLALPSVHRYLSQGVKLDTLLENLSDVADYQGEDAAEAPAPGNSYDSSYYTDDLEWHHMMNNLDPESNDNSLVWDQEQPSPCSYHSDKQPSSQQAQQKQKQPPRCAHATRLVRLYA